MFQQDDNKSLREYRALEATLHRDLMSCSRRYLNELGIVSIVGIMDIVKQEIIELERATKRSVDTLQDDNEDENVEGF